MFGAGRVVGLVVMVGGLVVPVLPPAPPPPPDGGFACDQPMLVDNDAAKRRPKNLRPQMPGMESPRSCFLADEHVSYIVRLFGVRIIPSEARYARFTFY